MTLKQLVETLLVAAEANEAAATPRVTDTERAWSLGVARGYRNAAKELRDFIEKLERDARR